MPLHQTYCINSILWQLIFWFNKIHDCITLRHKKYDLLVTKCSLPVLDGIWAADAESEIGFALSRQNFELFAFF